MRDEAYITSRSIPEPNSGCWLWLLSLSEGYACAHNGTRSEKAHRISYQIFKGPIGPGLEVDHTCRTRCCVNPEHLEAVTHKVNCERGDFRGGRCRPMFHPAPRLGVPPMNTQQQVKP